MKKDYQEYVDDTGEDAVDITQMAATELADHCMYLYEAAQRERKRSVKKQLVAAYNEAAKYFNDNIRNIMIIWKVN